MKNNSGQTVQINQGMVKFLQVFNRVEETKRQGEVNLLSSISSIGNKSTIALQSRLVLTSWSFPTKSHKQNFKISLQRTFATRYPGYGLIIKLNHVDYRKLNKGETTNNKGKITTPKTPTVGTPTVDTPTVDTPTVDTPTDQTAVIKRLETENNSLSDNLAVEKTATKQGKKIMVELRKEIKRLTTQVEELETKNSRLRRENSATKEMYSNLFAKVKSAKTMKQFKAING